MECTKIKDLLSEYIDDTLDAQTKGLIDKHILTCPMCQEELRSMKALVKELGAMEPIKAPDDFLEHIHKRMAPRFSFKRVIRILFIPGRIKIPLEFATATVMAILIFSIVYIQKPEKMIPDLSEGPVHIETPTLPLPLTATSPQRTQPSRSTESKEEGLGKGIHKPKAVADETTAWQPAEKREPIELALLLKAEEPAKADAPGRAMETTREPRVGTERKRSTGRAALNAKLKTDALKEEMQLRASVKESVPSSLSIFHETLSRVKKLIHLVEGRIISIEYDMQTKAPQSIHAEIPAKSYKSFYDQLRQLAVVQAPSPALSEKDQRPIRIRIRFLEQ